MSDAVTLERRPLDEAKELRTLIREASALGTRFRLAGGVQPLILLPVRVNDRGPFDFILDTGASRSLLSSELAKQLETKVIGSKEGQSAGGKVSVSLAKVESLAVGETKLQDVDVGVVDLAQIGKTVGAKIYGEISGYASTCEAFHRVRLEECGEEPARTIGLALEEAQIGPEAIDYINYHGTGTELNDRIETRAMKLAFNSHAYNTPGSSLKSLIGHPQGACGSAGIAATLLAMRDSIAPPTVNLEHNDPECDLDYIPHSARKLPIEYALANCIAFGSKNSAIVLRRL